MTHLGTCKLLSPAAFDQVREENERLKLALAQSNAGRDRLEAEHLDLQKDWGEVMEWRIELRAQWRRYQQNDLSREEFEGFVAEWAEREFGSQKDPRCPAPHAPDFPNCPNCGDPK